ncbi:CamS family sex pheromone protein [Virgibacillus xinjiangensis]|uniref:CamS family sex pheromone protein n=1 Tax=Virgibacillus xinjiangensis TaxID=393090 RepID=A0ABV7CTU2_9BACI
MKRYNAWLMIILLFLAACAPNNNEEEVVQEEDSGEETSIVPSAQLEDENYRMILPYKTSAARGVINNQVANRVDIDEFEQGLRRHSKEVYDPDRYFFQEGQYITESMVLEWIDALNPQVEEGAGEEIHRENPRYLSHILEQNFLVQGEDNTVSLEGISIGLAMKSVYRFQEEIGGPSYYEDISEEEMMEKADEIAQEVLERVREIEGLENVPVMFAIYREEEQSSPVPGNFVATTNVAGDSSSIGNWQDVNEEYILFPSDEGSDKYYEDQELVTSFGNEIAEFFPNYVGVIGEGFYINEELQKLTIEIPLDFYGKAEVIGFSQYVYGLVQDMFPDYYDLEIKVESSTKMESLIYREAGEEEPTVHVFH